MTEEQKLIEAGCSPAKRESRPGEKKETRCKVAFPVECWDKGKLQHIYNAEQELAKAGIRFDTAFDFKAGEREWQIDWSAKNAKIACQKKGKHS